MGVGDWFKKQPKRATGFVKKVVGADQIKDGAEYISTLREGLKARPETRETFENAVGRLNIKETDIHDSYKFHVFRFFLFVSLSVLAVVFGAYVASQGSWGAIAFIGFLSVSLSQIFNASFRMMQIRYRELLPVKFWVENPKEWWYRPLPKARSSSQKKMVTKPGSSIKNIKK